MTFEIGCAFGILAVVLGDLVSWRLNVGQIAMSTVNVIFL